MPHHHHTKTVVDHYSSSSSSDQGTPISNNAFAGPSVAVQTREGSPVENPTHITIQPSEPIHESVAPTPHVSVSFTANMNRQEKTNVTCSCCKSLARFFGC